jgi:hypothetical protein
MSAAARGYHVGGVVATMTDGSVRFVQNNIPLLIWNAMGTRAAADTAE